MFAVRIISIEYGAALVMALSLPPCVDETAINRNSKEL